MPENPFDLNALLSDLGRAERRASPPALGTRVAARLGDPRPSDRGPL
jgi:hypothetical protein